jgi:hypothetical protein
MKLFRLALTIGSLGLLAGGLSSCLKEPSFSSTPDISFNNIRLQRVTPTNQEPIDSIFITINFQDGDGDLGLTEAESKVSPYAYPSKFANNYFVEPQVKRPGEKVYSTPIGLYTGVAVPEGAYNGRFDHPSPLTDNKAAPLKGTLTRRLGFGASEYFNVGDKVRFTVSITDRALHVSNTITTDSVVIGR